MAISRASQHALGRDSDYFPGPYDERKFVKPLARARARAIYLSRRLCFGKRELTFFSKASPVAKMDPVFRGLTLLVRAGTVRDAANDGETWVRRKR